MDNKGGPIRSRFLQNVATMQGNDAFEQWQDQVQFPQFPANVIPPLDRSGQIRSLMNVWESFVHCS